MAEFSFTTTTAAGINVELDCEFQRLYHPYESPGPELESKIAGSCNGLLCQILIPKIWKGVIYGECDISLCNPLTKSSWVLPERLLVHILVCYGFGYDDVHDDYKVMITCWAARYRKYECEVYSLTSNTWSIVRSDLGFSSLVRNKDGVLVSCALHWIVKDTHPAHTYVIAFDLRTDEHKLFPLPEVLDKFKHGLELSVLNGCLLVYKDTIDFSFGRPDATCNFWVMKDYGFKDSWTGIRIRNLSCDLCSLVPVALLEDNHERKLVYFRYDNLGSMIFLYDIVSLEVLMFPVYNCWHINEWLEFVRSLVQPHPPKIEMRKSTFGESPKKKMKV